MKRTFILLSLVATSVVGSTAAEAREPFQSGGSVYGFRAAKWWVTNRLAELRGRHSSADKVVSDAIRYAEVGKKYPKSRGSQTNVNVAVDGALVPTMADQIGAISALVKNPQGIVLNGRPLKEWKVAGFAQKSISSYHELALDGPADTSDYDRPGVSTTRYVTLVHPETNDQINMYITQFNQYGAKGRYRKLNYSTNATARYGSDIYGEYGYAAISRPDTHSRPQMMARAPQVLADGSKRVVELAETGIDGTVRVLRYTPGPTPAHVTEHRDGYNIDAHYVVNSKHQMHTAQNSQ